MDSRDSGSVEILKAIGLNQGSRSFPFESFAKPWSEFPEASDALRKVLTRLHEAVFLHLSVSGMKKTAAAFLEESPFYPCLKSLATVEGIVASDRLYQAWIRQAALQSDLAAPGVEACHDVAQVQLASPAASCMELPLKEERMDPPALDETCPAPSGAGALDADSYSDESEDGQPRSGGRARFACRIPNCTQMFTTFANMKRHEKLHVGDRPHTCPHEGCDKSFARKYDLKVHARVHSNEKPYLCPHKDCNKRFSRKSTLKEHRRNIHAEDDAAMASFPKPTDAPVRPGVPASCEVPTPVGSVGSSPSLSVAATPLPRSPLTEISFYSDPSLLLGSSTDACGGSDSLDIFALLGCLAPSSLSPEAVENVSPTSAFVNAGEEHHMLPPWRASGGIDLVGDGLLLPMPRSP